MSVLSLKQVPVNLRPVIVFCIPAWHTKNTKGLMFQYKEGMREHSRFWHEIFSAFGSVTISCARIYWLYLFYSIYVCLSMYNHIPVVPLV